MPCSLIFIIRPEWRWKLRNGSVFEFTPKIYSYLDKEENPDIQEYLINRFQLLGTADECEARLRQVAADAGLDGCWFTQSPLTPDEDPIQRVRTTGEALQSLAGFEPARG